MSLHKLNVQSIALYGSHARGDADLISDSDLLIVDSDPNALSEASSALHAHGFSCASYTWQRLSYMVAHGSLFLQHLKTESVILKDANSSLENLLHSFHPKQDYSSDIETTKSVVALTEHICQKKALIGWACDLLAVAVRNIGILEIANRGEYAFSMASIYDKLIDFGVLSHADVRVLQPLRLYKSLYRSRQYTNLPTIRSLQLIQKTISRCFQIDCDSKVLAAEELCQSFLSKSQKHPDKYCRFRLLEGAAVPYLYSSTMLPDDTVHRFNKLVANQNHYGLFYHDLSVPLRDAAMDIINRKFGQQAHAADRL